MNLVARHPAAVGFKQRREAAALSIVRRGVPCYPFPYAAGVFGYIGAELSLVCQPAAAAVFFDIQQRIERGLRRGELFQGAFLRVGEREELFIRRASEAQGIVAAEAAQAGGAYCRGFGAFAYLTPVGFIYVGKLSQPAAELREECVGRRFFALIFGESLEVLSQLLVSRRRLGEVRDFL